MIEKYRYALNDKTLDKFVEYAVNVWGIAATDNKYETARLAIAGTRNYFISLGVPSTLGEVGIGHDNLREMANRAASRRQLGSFKPLNADDVFNIYNVAL